MSNAKHKAVFLDRDNTLIEDPGYINHPSQVRLMPGTAASLSQLRKMDFKTIVVSNQSGVARGIVTEEVLAQIHHQLEKLLADEGAFLEAIYYCPFHPDGVIEQYRRESELRKPAPGMLLKAAEELHIDLSGSWMIGDSYRDIEAGKRAGCKTILINNPVKPAIKNPSDPDPDRQAVNIREAVNIIRMHELRHSMESTLEHKHQEPAPVSPTPTPAPAEKPPVSVPAARQSEPKPVRPATGEITNKELQDKMKPSEPVKTVPAGPAPAAAEKHSKDLSKPVEPYAPEPVEVKKPIVSEKTPALDREPHLSPKTELLLQELLGHLKSSHRVGQYEDFTLSKVAAAAAQVLAVTCVIVSLWSFVDPTRGESWTLMMLGYAGVLQLMAIAFYMMRER